MANVFFVFIGVSSIASGIAPTVWPHRRREKALHDRAERMAAIDAGAPETYFEERRTLDAYPPPRSDRRMRFLGVGQITLGTAILLLDWLG
ncbi:hypothetical protein MTR62_02395 [Novosphingobium sp. 1949]|uniref:Uncharacterized protein n=1 Tax=Novosphingobium organovorum TaxID=2930092 RepID=A0ABT0B948_9SPHN|nr:hypothetical protein [Novosphingobium organovorum]MCJ2181564.1 hypothetical protein [Novosphingobium organovorum]